MKFKIPGKKRAIPPSVGALFENLPVEVKVSIFKNLSNYDLRQCRLVCGHWNDVIFERMKPLRVQLNISFPSDGSPQMTAQMKSVSKRDIESWPSAMSVSSVVCEGFCESYSPHWSEIIADILDQRPCSAIDELRAVNVLHSQMATKKLLRHKSFSNITSATFCDRRLTPHMITEICRFAKGNRLLKSFHVSGFDVDHFDEIFDTVLKCPSVIDCSTIAKRGSCTSSQLLHFLKAIISVNRMITVHGLSIDDLQFNGAMRELQAPYRKGYHLCFFSSNTDTYGPDIAVVFDKSEGPALMMVAKTTENVLFHREFLGSLIRQELQDQKSYSSVALKIAGNFTFSETDLLICTTISAISDYDSMKSGFFDCKKVEMEIGSWFEHYIRRYKILIKVKIDSSKSNLFLRKVFHKLQGTEQTPEPPPLNKSPVLFHGHLNSPKALGTLAAMRPQRWTQTNQYTYNPYPDHPNQPYNSHPFRRFKL